MNDQAPTQPALDPDEMLQLPAMKRSDIGNLMACVDIAMRARGIEVIDVHSAVAALARAEPLPKAEPDRPTA